MESGPLQRALAQGLAGGSIPAVDTGCPMCMVPAKPMLGTAYRAFLPDSVMCWHQASVTVGTHASLPLPQLLHQLNVGALTDEFRTCPEEPSVFWGHLFSDVLADRHGAPRSSVPGLRVHHSAIALMGRDLECWAGS